MIEPAFQEWLDRAQQEVLGGGRLPGGVVLLAIFEKEGIPWYSTAGITAGVLKDLSFRAQVVNTLLHDHPALQQNLHDLGPGCARKVEEGLGIP